MVGSSTARNLASSGTSTLLLEQVSYLSSFVEGRLLDALIVNVHLGKIST